MTPPPLVFRSTLLCQGWTDSELRRMRRAGQLAVLRPGSYLTDAGPESPEARHAVLVHATLPHLAPGWVVSHQSAAVLFGLPVWGVPLDRVHVSRDGSGGGRVTRGVHRHLVPLPDEDVVTVEGVRVTAAARTIADVASVVPFEQAVVVADAALAPRADGRPLTVPAALRAAVARSGRTGRAAARRAVAFADGGGRSPGESRSRVAMWSAGLPPPLLQYEVGTSDGRRIGFVDFGWPELRTVGEFDGRTKYGRLLSPGQTAGDAVFAEKIREDAMRATGLGMTRWGWRDLDAFDPVAARLRRQYRGAAHLLATRAWPDMRG